MYSSLRFIWILPFRRIRTKRLGATTYHHLEATTRKSEWHTLGCAGGFADFPVWAFPRYPPLPRLLANPELELQKRPQKENRCCAAVNGLTTNRSMLTWFSCSGAVGCARGIISGKTKVGESGT